MDVRWLEDFLLLAANRSFVRAAAERHVSQAAFGRRIKAIEAWVGVPLIDRSEFPISLTAQGVLFRDAAETAVRTLLDARDLLRGAADSQLVGVSVATGKSLALNFFPAWYDALRMCVPGLRVRVSTAAMPDATLLLVEGAVDFLLSYWNDEIPLLLDPVEFESLSVGRERLVPLCVPTASGRPRWPLPGAAQSPSPWLRVSENTRQGRVIRSLIATHKLNLTPVYEADFSEALADLALRGLGLAWLPQRVALPALAAGTLVHAGGPQHDAHFDIRLYRRLSNRKPWVEAAWRAALDNAAAV